MTLRTLRNMAVPRSVCFTGGLQYATRERKRASLPILTGSETAVVLRVTAKMSRVPSMQSSSRPLSLAVNT